MSRIYQGGSAESRYRQTDLGQRYAPGKAASGERQAKEWKQQVIQDGQTKARDLERKAQSENLQSKLEMNVEASGLKQQQLANEIELKMDQTYETNTLKQEQLYEKLSMDMEASELKAQQSVASANLQAMSTAVSGLLSFAGSAVKYASEIQGLKDEEARKQAVKDSGRWAFTSDYEPSSPSGQAVVQAEQQQGTIEVVEEAAISHAAPGNPATQEALRQSVGIDQTEARLQNQISVGEAAATIQGRLRDAFYDPNRTVTVVDASGQAVQIRPMDAKSGQLNQVLKSLGQQLTQEMGLARPEIDRYTAVTQYVPKLEAAINAVSSSEYAGRLAGEQSNREQLGFTRASQTLANGDVAGSWAQYYQAAAISGLYDGDQRRITKAAVEAFVQDATPAQLEQLKKGSIRVFKDGPTFAKDERFSGLIDEALRNKKKGLITDYNQNIKFQEIELSNATNSHAEALMGAGDDPQATQQAHEAYEAKLGELSRAGNAKARSELIKQHSIGNNYNPENYQNLRERIANGETFTEDFLKQQLSSFHINPREYDALKKAGLATPERVENVYGGTQAYKAQNDSTKASINQYFLTDKDNTFFSSASLAPDVRRGIIQNLGVDIIKRRDIAVSEFVASNGGPEKVSQGDVTQFSTAWSDSNIPKLLSGVTIDTQTGVITGYNYLGATFNKEKPVEYNSIYVRNKDGSPYLARDWSERTPVDLAILKNKTEFNYAGDSILTREEKLSGAKAYVAGEAFPPGVISKATALGVTPEFLVREQARGIGKELGNRPTESVVQKMSLEGASDMDQGMQLIRAHNVPPRGAAYLAGNIQQESSWNGMRDWDQVMGDGTSRNGGLVSWASWSDDPARLGKIESYLGKDISKATHSEQIGAMLWEMKSSYQSSYRVFMNPNATDAQLRRASKDYWGYGHEGDRFRYSKQLLSV